MQDQFVADIGDYAKYALLRAVVGDRLLGVAWYLHPDKGTGGSHIEYLENPDAWRPIDCELFDRLSSIIRRCQAKTERRSVRTVQNRNLFPRVIYSRELLRTNIVPNNPNGRNEWRAHWFKRVKVKLASCGMVFVDPDDGLCLVNQGDVIDWKKLPSYEGTALSQDGGRPTVIYHQFRRGATIKEMDQDIVHWIRELPGNTYAFWVRRWVNRVFFVINPDKPMTARLIAFVQRWQSAERRWRNERSHRRQAELSVLYGPDGQEMQIWPRLRLVSGPGGNC